MTVGDPVAGRCVEGLCMHTDNETGHWCHPASCITRETVSLYKQNWSKCVWQRNCLRFPPDGRFAKTLTIGMTFDIHVGNVIGDYSYLFSKALVIKSHQTQCSAIAAQNWLNRASEWSLFRSRHTPKLRPAQGLLIWKCAKESIEKLALSRRNGNSE